MQTQTHIIGKKLLHVRSRGAGDEMQLQRDIEELYSRHILPGLEQLLDKYGQPGRVVTIDKLSVSLTGVKACTDKESLARQILNELEKEIRSSLEQDIDTATHQYSRQERLLQTWVYYLERGFLPWWANAKNMSDWREQLHEFLHAADTAILQPLRQSLDKPGVIARICVQLNHADFRLFFGHISGWDKQLLQDVFEDEQHIAAAVSAHIGSNRFRQLFRQELLSVVKLSAVPQRSIHVFAERLLKAIVSYNPAAFHAVKQMSLLHTTEIATAVQLAKQTDQQKANKLSKPDMPEVLQVAGKDDEARTDGIYIHNAGVILAAPYLSRLFEHLQLVSEKRITDQEWAVAVIQYIGSGKEHFEEAETVLSKILCGLEPETVITGSYRLTADDKKQVDDMLAAVIAHWEVLKNTSVAALRETFLQREGQLLLKEQNWMLRVQEQPYDVLLDHLPWSISIIRLPWMQLLLQVQWR